MQQLTSMTGKASPQEELMELALSGIVHTDSFLPIRQYLNQEKINKAPLRQRVNALSVIYHGQKHYRFSVFGS